MAGSSSPPPAAPARPGVRKDRTLQSRRTFAKAGMLAAMGVLTWSAMAGRRVLRRYHPAAGVALLGFTAWHMLLYQRRQKPPRRDAVERNRDYLSARPPGAPTDVAKKSPQ